MITVILVKMVFDVEIILPSTNAFVVLWRTVLLKEAKQQQNPKMFINC